MATFTKRKGKRGIRWTVRIRREGQKETKTFGTRGAAEEWARRHETAIETGTYLPPNENAGALLADLVDDFLVHRKRIGRPPGATFANALARLKTAHGLETADSLNVSFWRRHALDRIADGIDGSTVASDLAYAGSVLRHAARAGYTVDAAAPGLARTMLREDGVRVVSRQRTRRLSPKFPVWFAHF